MVLLCHHYRAAILNNFKMRTLSKENIFILGTADVQRITVCALYFKNVSSNAAELVTSDTMV
jgi:hypothetical protein